MNALCCSKWAGVFIVSICTIAWGADAPTTAPVEKRIAQVELRELPLVDAARLLARQTGINLVCSAEAGKTPVSLFLQDVSAGAAIDELCKAHNLWYRRDEKSGVLRIMTVAEFQRDLMSFREERTQVFTLLYPNVQSVATAIADLYGDRVQFSSSSQESDDDLRDLRDRFERFDLLDQRSQGLGLFEGGGTSTTGSSNRTSNYGSYSNSDSGYGRTNSSIRRRTEDRRTSDTTAAPDRTRELQPLTAAQAEAITRLMDQRKSPAEQEAMLEAFRRSRANIYVTAIRRNNQLIVRTSDQSTMEEIDKLVKKLDVPTPLVLLEVKVLSIDLGDGFNSAFDYQLSDGTSIAGGFSQSNILPPLSDALTGTARRNASLAPAGLNTGNLVFQYVSNSFRARLQLLEDKNRITQLATPMVLTANNEVSRLFVGEERPIIRNISSQTVVNDNNVTTSPNTTVEFRPVGTTLLIAPTINADRTVTLRILQENSRIIPNGAQIPVVSGSGAVQSQPVDVVSARTISGTIVAKDSLTMALGGLIEEEISDVRSEVPVLGKLPLLGILFRRQDTQRSRRELVVLVRPHVLNTATESEGLSRRLLEELSIHPKSGDPGGTLGTYKPHEVLVPNPPATPKDAIFRFHSVKPDDF